jgi:hypothetical protein
VIGVFTQLFLTSSPLTHIASSTTLSTLISHVETSDPNAIDSEDTWLNIYKVRPRLTHTEIQATHTLTSPTAAISP